MGVNKLIIIKLEYSNDHRSSLESNHLMTNFLSIILSKLLILNI